jgi:hypothetical protein
LGFGGSGGSSPFTFAHSASDTNFDFTNRFYATNATSSTPSRSSGMVLKRSLRAQTRQRAIGSPTADAWATDRGWMS